VVEAATPTSSRESPRPDGARPNAVVLAAVTVTALVLGLLPWIDITERGWVAAVLGAVWLVTALLRARVLLTAAVGRPRIWELGVGVVSSLFPASFLSALALAAYGAGLLFGELLSALDLIGSVERGSGAEDAAFAFSAFVAFVTCPVCAILATDNTSQQLYPQTAGVQVAYKTLLAQEKRRRAILLYGLPAVVAGAATLLLPGVVFVVAAQVFVLAWSSTVFRLGRLERTSADQLLLYALGEAFTAKGYAVVESPRTGDAAVDPMVVCVNLLAYDSERAFAVELKTSMTSQSRIPWAEAASIELAAATLTDVAWQLDVRAGRVEPVLVLVGEEPSEPLRAFCKREDVHLLVIPGGGEPDPEDVAKAVDSLADVELVMQEAPWRT
jgi:hypothetical protein